MIKSYLTVITLTPYAGKVQNLANEREIRELTAQLTNGDHKVLSHKDLHDKVSDAELTSAEKLPAKDQRILLIAKSIDTVIQPLIGLINKIGFGGSEKIIDPKEFSLVDKLLNHKEKKKAERLFEILESVSFASKSQYSTESGPKPCVKYYVSQDPANILAIYEKATQDLIDFRKEYGLLKLPKTIKEGDETLYSRCYGEVCEKDPNDEATALGATEPALTVVETIRTAKWAITQVPSDSLGAINKFVAELLSTVETF